MEILFQVLALLYVVCTIVLCIRGTFKISTPLILLQIAQITMVVGLICQYAPPGNIPSDPLSYLIPYGVTVSVLMLLIVSIFFEVSEKDTGATEQATVLRWFLLIISIAAKGIAMMATLTCWYAPHVFGSNTPLPMTGVILNLSGVLLCAALLYIVTRYNSVKRPNLMRKIVMLLIVCGFPVFSLALSLILLYAFPAIHVKSYPLEAGVNMISALIWSALLLIVHRSAVDERAIPVKKKQITVVTG